MGEVGSWEDFKKHHLIVETYMNEVGEVNRLLSKRKKNFNKENHFIVLPSGEKARDRFKNEVSRAALKFFYIIPPFTLDGRFRQPRKMTEQK